LTVKERIVTIRLFEKIVRNPEYARRIGLDMNKKERLIHSREEKGKALG